VPFILDAYGICSNAYVREDGAFHSPLVWFFSLTPFEDESIFKRELVS
jgi:hypothetical protein